MSRTRAGASPTLAQPRVPAQPPAPAPRDGLRTAGRRILRRRLTIALVAASVAALLGWYVVYTRGIVRELRREGERQTRTYARVYRALQDPTEGRDLEALFEIAEAARTSGVPAILTDRNGNPTGAVNLPFDEVPLGARTREYVAILDRQNPPVVDSATGTTVHYGDSRLVRQLNVVPALQVAALGMLLCVGVYALLVRARADREHVWAGMARESAHQLGTPLTSLSGWIALLDDAVADDGDAAPRLLQSAVPQMKADLERLERVAHRFERIGRPPRRDPVDLGVLCERIAGYFRARVPTRTHAVAVNAHTPAEPLVVEGDAVLLEWVLEALTKNSVDALAGRGGRIDIVAERLEDGRARVRVADDGPGVPRDMRRRIFDAGFSTKERGWGIGLSLARRIVEENHGGRLALAATDRGAAFDVILR
jgi:signal transduction histidine kinase